MRLRKLLSAAALMPLATVIACGGGESADTTPGPAETTPAAVAPDLSNAGGISGTVTFTGAAPEGAVVQMAADPFCQTQHSEAVTQSPILVDAAGGLANAVVYVSGGLEGYAFEAPAESVTIDQHGCLYEPHVLALQTGQTLVIHNSDDTLHNVNMQPESNRAFNQGMPLVNMTFNHTFDNPEVGIPVRCDVHPWMNAFVSVFEHPYFAVSGADGSFAIPQLPPGDYVISVWHENLAAPQTQNVTVAPNETATIAIGFGG